MYRLMAHAHQMIIEIGISSVDAKTRNADS